MDLAHGRNGKEMSLGFTQRTCTQLQVRIFQNRNRFFKPSLASNVSSPSIATSKEREFVVEAGAFISHDE